MYHSGPDSTPGGAHDLALLEKASFSPDETCKESPEVREAFENGLRQLAEDILEFHPSLAHVLLGMGENANPIIHGQN